MDGVMAIASAGAWTERPTEPLTVNSARDWLRLTLISAAVATLFAVVGALALGRLPLNLYDVSFTLNWGAS